MIKLPIVNERSRPRRPGRPRNADLTRARIVAAARREFGRSGFAGARIGTIARTAGVNSSLIFYYFENKEGLYRAVSERRLATYAPPAQSQDIFDWPLWLFGLAEETQDAVRFVLREGIDAEESHAVLPEQARRRESFLEQVERVRRVQQSGGLPSDLDTEHLTLFLYVLGVYPYVLPQIATLISGHAPEDPVFRAQFERFIRDLADVLAG